MRGDLTELGGSKGVKSLMLSVASRFKCPFGIKLR